MLVLLGKLLQLNSSRIPPSHKGNKSAKKRHIITSFILPVGAIELPKVGQLSKNDSCKVCGKKTTGRCSRCMGMFEVYETPPSSMTLSCARYTILQ